MRNLNIILLVCCIDPKIAEMYLQWCITQALDAPPGQYGERTNKCGKEYKKMLECKK